MADEPNFLDLVALSKITPDLVVEKFGSKINSSFFDGSNMLGTLRLKNLIDFTANFPGQSVITITEIGKQLLKEAADKSVLPFDGIDLSILQQLQAGKRTYIDIGNAVNLRSKDLAMHLYKLSQQQYAVDEIKNGTIDIMLTEKGLMQAKTGMPPAPSQEQGAPVAQQTVQQPAMQQGQMAAQATPMPAQGMQPQQPGITPPSPSFEDIEKQIKMAKGGPSAGKLKIVVVVVVLIVAIIIVLYGKGIIKF
jgi:hypothetical protein